MSICEAAVFMARVVDTVVRARRGLWRGPSKCFSIWVVMHRVRLAYASLNSKYSSVSGSQSQTGSSCARRGTVGSMFSLKHMEGHLFKVMVLVAQSIFGLCLLSQSVPRSTSWSPVLVTKRFASSMCWVPISIWRVVA